MKGAVGKRFLYSEAAEKNAVNEVLQCVWYSSFHEKSHFYIVNLFP